MAQSDTEPSASASAPHVRVRRVGLTPASAVLIVGAVVTAFVLRDAFVAAHRIVGWVVACAIVALLVGALVDIVERRLPRWISVIVVLGGIFAVVGGVMAGLALDVLDSLDELQTSAPEAAAALEDRFAWASDIGAADRVQAFVDELNDRVRERTVTRVAGTAPTYLITGILMLFLLFSGRRYFDAFVLQFPSERRDTIRTVATSGAVRGRRYLLIAIAHSLVNGVIVGLLCWMLDLPAALSLGFFVGTFTIIPVIGVIIGGVPALLLAFGAEGTSTGVVVLIVLLLLQFVEVSIVRPWVDPRTVRLGPAAATIVGLLGFELYGIGGAVYGIALTVIALAALDAAGHDDDDEVRVSS
ncbi:MAG TPA: AI-2E family transporter [Ilumatobacteraceae bacterium]|nr:AI-2E family transporter [Ilumatobacteraceae bacterium]